jgi:hypothetical protein
MPRTLFALLLSGSLALAADCPDCDAAKQKTCEKHAAADKDAAEALRKGLADPNPDNRFAAIQAYAKACEEHANCRPPANAMVLGTALKDPNGDVKAEAAARLGAQDPRTATALLEKEVEPVVKRLAKDPKGADEEEKWLQDFAFVTGIAEGCAGIGEMAGAVMARILTSTRYKVLTMACRHVAAVRSKKVPPALIDAMEKVLTSVVSQERDQCWVEMIKAWEGLTKSNIKQPVATDAADGRRYLSDCRSWWKANERTWK